MRRSLEMISIAYRPFSICWALFCNSRLASLVLTKIMARPVSRSSPIAEAIMSSISVNPALLRMAGAKCPPALLEVRHPELGRHDAAARVRAVQAVCAIDCRRDRVDGSLPGDGDGVEAGARYGSAPRIGQLGRHVVIHAAPGANHGA